jgi:hypothetical protein
MLSRHTLVLALAVLSSLQFLPLNRSAAQSSANAQSPIIISIEETITEPAPFAGYHDTGKLTWNGQQYLATFQPLLKPNGRPAGPALNGIVTLIMSGDRLTMHREDRQGTRVKADYIGTMSSGTHGEGTVTLTNMFGVFHGTFKADLTFAPQTPPATSQTTPTNLQQPVGTSGPGNPANQASTTSVPATTPSQSAATISTRPPNPTDQRSSSTEQSTETNPAPSTEDNESSLVRSAAGKSDLSGNWIFSYGIDRTKSRIVQHGDNVSITIESDKPDKSYMEMFKGAIEKDRIISGHLSDDYYVKLVARFDPKDVDELTIISSDRLRFANGGEFQRGSALVLPKLAIPPAFKAVVDLARKYTQDCMAERFDDMKAETAPEELVATPPDVCQGWAKSH